LGAPAEAINISILPPVATITTATVREKERRMGRRGRRGDGQQYLI